MTPKEIADKFGHTLELMHQIKEKNHLKVTTKH